jgi:chromosome segregation ATPase
VLGAWLYITKGDISVLEYQIRQLEEKLDESDIELKEAEKAVEKARKEREEQFRKSEKIIADLEKDIEELGERILAELKIQEELRARIEALKNQPKPDYSGTTDAELAQKLTNNISRDHPKEELDPVKVLAAAQFFFTREVAESMNTSLLRKFGLEQQLVLTGEWIESKERETTKLKSTIDNKDGIITEKDAEIQALIKEFEKRSSEVSVLQSQNALLRQLSDGKDDVITQMKRRQWVERGIGVGLITAVIVAAVASAGK